MLQRYVIISILCTFHALKVINHVETLHEYQRNIVPLQAKRNKLTYFIEDEENIVIRKW